MPEDGPRPLNLPEGQSYTRSPLESAFQTLIKEKFDASLSDPMVLENAGTLRRTSLPVQIEGATAVFQYSRRDPMDALSIAVADAYKLAHPSDRWLPPYSEVTDFTARSNEVDIIAHDIAQDKIEAGENPHELDRALIEPDYYSPGVPLVQPAETFEFTLFTGAKKPEPTDIPTPILEGSVGNIRAQFYGVLKADPRYEGVKPSYPHEDTFTIIDPSFDYLTDRAATIALVGNFEPTDEEIMEEANDFYIEGESKGFSPDFDDLSPLEVMDDLGNFIYVLAAGE